MAKAAILLVCHLLAPVEEFDLSLNIRDQTHREITDKKVNFGAL